ncbi:Uma2 family endonuclease [Streptomyces meridianus]|uniref:Uma2 family endonuclease n=1 Tax=Streptomyces meridianus TaxID=2938945 RepID=A0ABT0X6M7_9ACTN|nr:Uma2 family endonuclease [Streptomyces meridianus]MCM2577995.1 Uma2 family endonuclease [Streptomyces meridianus]
MSVAYESHSGPWTVDDVLALPEDPRHRIELVGGALLMTPNPGVPHQRVSYRLRDLLQRAADACDAGVEVLEAVNLPVPDGLLIPDIVVVNADFAADAEVTVDPHEVLVVIEILSPSTRITDLKTKPALYAAAGIAAYWRLDLVPMPRLIVSELHQGTYADRLTALAGATTRIGRPFPFDLDPADLARAPR